MTHAIKLILAVTAALGLSVAAHAQDSNVNTPVNSQITDSVSQANTEVLGEAPAVSMGNLYSADAIPADSEPAHNVTAAQQNANTVLQATTTQGVQLLTGFGSEAEAGESGDGEADPDR